MRESIRRPGVSNHIAAWPANIGLGPYGAAASPSLTTHRSNPFGVAMTALFRASQALAAVDGRDYVTPDDVKRMVVPVFAHRVLLATRAAAGQRWAGAAEKVLEEILTLVDVPL